MTFTKSITACLTKYGNFKGRAVRSEFWWFSLFFLILTWAAQIVDATVTGGELPVNYLIVTLALLLPDLAVGARRLHDVGRSGWWQLLYLTIIGVVLLIYWWAQEGTKEENKYDPVSASDDI